MLSNSRRVVEISRGLCINSNCSVHKWTFLVHGLLYMVHGADIWCTASFRRYTGGDFGTQGLIYGAQGALHGAQSSFFSTQKPFHGTQGAL